MGLYGLSQVIVALSLILVLFFRPQRPVRQRRAGGRCAVSATETRRDDRTPREGRLPGPRPAARRARAPGLLVIDVQNWVMDEANRQPRPEFYADASGGRDPEHRAAGGGGAAATASR